MFTKIDDETTELPQTAIAGVTADETVTDSATESAPETEADPLAGDDEADAETTDAEEIASESAGQTEAGESASESAGQTEAGESASEDENNGGTDTFSRAYVEKLRRESAGYRERAQRADELATRLHTALVAATGRLADPTDLAFDAAHLDDEQALTDAIDDLLARKPHLASRRPFGDVGQGQQGKTSEPVNLADLLRSRA